MTTKSKLAMQSQVCDVQARELLAVSTREHSGWTGNSNVGAGFRGATDSDLQRSAFARPSRPQNAERLPSAAAPAAFLAFSEVAAAAEHGDEARSTDDRSCYKNSSWVLELEMEADMDKSS